MDQLNLVKSGENKEDLHETIVAAKYQSAVNTYTSTSAGYSSFTIIYA
ncbi:protein of unknown function [Legionella hackeliae]|uniref:Uncharacterized protein n=1 Tax=Legionella hackeliae TaxID=449 RepID=A0A0A8ULF6_LEGHA|nr:protein of unknown function [Legionella hackeliae]